MAKDCPNRCPANENHHFECAHLNSLGIAYADLGEVRKAIEYYDHALAISREIGDRRSEGNRYRQPGHRLLRIWVRWAGQGRRILRSGAGHQLRDRKQAR